MPGLIFATDYHGGWQESVLETAIILLVATPVIMLPIEDFLQRRFDTQASHGICPACRAEQRKSAGLKRAS